MNKFKRWILKLLRIDVKIQDPITIDTLFDFRGDAARNTMWYRGDSYELEQFYSQYIETNNTFWGANSSRGLEIRKIHVGVPKLLVNTLTNITVSDLSPLKFNDVVEQETWDEIARVNKINKLINKATKNVLKVGDGAFKIGFKESISNYPLIEFYSGDKVEFVYDRGHIREIHFFNYYDIKNINYTLEEVYGYGYIKYHLYKNEKEVKLDTLDFLADLEDIEFDKTKMLAVPYKIFESETHEGRGASIFDGKTDCFDALDEVVSEWIDAIRAGRVQTYIPETLIPKDPNGGFILRPNPFDNRFIAVGADMSENAKNEIVVKQPDIKTESYLQTYITMLDMALQGLISPSTLGIDTKKLDNAESQREKEKTTLYTRQTIVDVLTDVLKELAQVVFDANALQSGTDFKKIKVDVDFGEYANPSFEAVCETLAKARPGQQLMSIEAQVEEMWGDGKSDEWKAEEVQRIKNESGVEVFDEPALYNDVE